jgi:hypothetical protein
MPKKIQNTTKAALISVPLPNHAATYTVISHQFVIDYAFQSLAAAGFGIVEEEYRCTADGQIAQGIYRLNFNADPELSMMFAWTNSYNKQVKFKCVIGAYINETGSVMISGNIGNWVRKHTGTADTEVKDTIDQYVSNAHMYYNQLCSDKLSMEAVILNKRRQAQLLGVLFAEYEILTTEQASIIREQMKKPKQVFTNTDSLWAFYNFVTNALQYSHPKTWMEDQRILHFFIGTICNLSAPVQPVSAPVPDLTAPPQDLSAPVEEVDPLYVIPNQTNILDQIAEIETENDDTYDDTSDENDDTSTEVTDNQVVQQDPEMLEIVHQVEEILESLDEAEETPFDLDAEDDAILDIVLRPISPIEFKAENPTLETGDHVKYTDPAGNTFEAPIVPPCAGHDAETEKEEFLSLEPTIEDIQAYEEQEQKEYMEPIEANLDLVEKEDDNSDFDLDFGVSEDDEDSSNIPDFF